MKRQHVTDRVDVQRFQAAIREGLNTYQLAQRFAIGPSTAGKWRKKLLGTKERPS